MGPSRKRFLILGAFIGTLLLGAGCLYLIKTPGLKPAQKIHAKDIAFLLQDGDVICRLGDRLWSGYFKDISITDKRFSHMGIVHIQGGSRSGKITVINAEGRAMAGKDFVNEVPLEEFLDIALAAGIYRLRDHDGGTLSGAAREYIGYPFDWSFDLEEERRLYCTELLYVVLKKTAPEVKLKTLFQKELSKELIPLEACSSPDYFDEIAYITVH
jgi:hypothetical protein